MIQVQRIVEHQDGALALGSRGWSVVRPEGWQADQAGWSHEDMS